MASLVVFAFICEICAICGSTSSSSRAQTRRG